MPMICGRSGWARAIKQQTFVVPISSAAIRLPRARANDLTGRRGRLFSGLWRPASFRAAFVGFSRVRASSIAVMYFSPLGVLSWLALLLLAARERRGPQADPAGACRSLAHRAAG